MANLNKVVYLSEAQKETLFTNGFITVDGRTIEYSDNDLYVTPSAIDTAPAQGSSNLITSGAVYNAIPNAGNISGAGVISIKHGNTELFTIQLPLYTGGVSNGA